jgi:hypothetical protein
MNKRVLVVILVISFVAFLGLGIMLYLESQPLGLNPISPYPRSSQLNASAIPREEYFSLNQCGITRIEKEQFLLTSDKASDVYSYYKQLINSSQKNGIFIQDYPDKVRKIICMNDRGKNHVVEGIGVFDTTYNEVSSLIPNISAGSTIIIIYHGVFLAD